MAGRILGHNFIHAGSGLPGLSLAVVKLLTGGETGTAAADLTLEDVADLEHRETIGLVSNTVKSLIAAQCSMFVFSPIIQF